jgi:hypothetical protein
MSQADEEIVATDEYFVVKSLYNPYGYEAVRKTQNRKYLKNFTNFGMGTERMLKKGWDKSGNQRKTKKQKGKIEMTGCEPRQTRFLS